jgi:diketogulonate reductase-like aldo/keto reductase
MLPNPGTSKVAHLQHNVAAADIHLSDEEFASLDREDVAEPVGVNKFRKYLSIDYVRFGKTGLEVSRLCVEARGVPRAQVTLAWLLQKKGITAPIVGASKSSHLTDAVACALAQADAGRNRLARGAICTAQRIGVLRVPVTRLLRLNRVTPN